jgi:hypothetical protein
MLPGVDECFYRDLQQTVEERRELAKSEDRVSRTNIRRRQRFICTSIGASAEPDSPNSVIYAACNIGVQLIANEQHVMPSKPTSAQCEIEELRSGLAKSCIDGSDDPYKETPDPGSVKEVVKLRPSSGLRIRPYC